VAWQQAAATLGTSDTAQAYRLNAADALVKAGDTTAALALVRSLPASLAPDLAVRRTLVAADIALLNGDAAAALALVGPAIQTQDVAVLQRYRRTRAEALLLRGDSLASARELALLDASIRSPQASYDNRQRIWSRLKDVVPATLASFVTAPPEAFSGWVELANLARSFAIEPDALDSAVAQWTVRYPGHPAGEQIVPELLEQVRADAQPPTRVALLVPESGDFAAVGASIRDGFMAAWRTDAPNPRRPAIEVIDTASVGPVQGYTRAVASGAQMVVGPLTKDAVAAVLAGTGVPVNTITLNYPTPSAEGDAAIPERAFIFALSPEDEAERVADLGRAQGAEIAGVLAPAGEWGERVSSAFTRHWESLGGAVAVVELFSDEPTSLSESVVRMLNIEASTARATALRGAIGRNLQFNPKPRSDLDFLFLAAFPIEARQVKPLLAFHRAGDLPVLATSHVFTGTPDRDLDQDVEGVVFGDMPWLITPEIYGLPEQISNALPDARGTLTRLYAFGADAYALVGQLPKLRAGIDTPYPGLSGRLSLDTGQRIRRELQWARFSQGAPVPISGEGSLHRAGSTDLEPTPTQQ
jgi:outer membrane PBP1 activator LpoA protein